jgi:hypothetical protein
MERTTADFRGEDIIVSERPSCPYCGSRRRIVGPVGHAVTHVERRSDGSRPRGAQLDVWLCNPCPTLKRQVYFGVVVHVPGTGWEPINLGAVSAEGRARAELLERILDQDRPYLSDDHIETG